MARRQSRAAKRAQRNLYMYGVLILVVVVAVLAGVVYWWINRNPPLTDALCPGNGPAGHVVLLVDKTDPLTFVQRESFDIFLKGFVERGVAPGELVSVFALGENYQDSAKPLFEMCNPGTGADKSEWTDNLKKLHEQYQNRFYQPMLQLATQLQTVTPGKTSPIFEMLQLVSVNAFKKHTAINGTRRLVIVSDMLHNTSAYSMYGTVPDYASFAPTAYGRQTHVDLTGVNIDIQYLVNAPNLQTRRHVLFWEQYFNQAGGRLTSVQPF